ICDTVSGLDGIVKHTTHAPVMVGNILGKRKLNTCFRCCANDGDIYRPCNLNQCSMQAISLSTNVASISTIPSKARTTLKTTATSPTTTPTSTTTTPTSTTTTPTSITTTTPPLPTSCYLCNGMPIYICEQFSTPLQCATPDQQYCLNILVNNRDGSRTLNRTCATEDECRVKWWDQTSDRPECSGYDPSSGTRMYFTCTFCCTSPDCNKNILPDNLYTPHKM
ncbi:integumentary mucin C.1-like, partial [Saccostrea cucullata]|uniref:integumentary mucin C.1-like n=1 Tax=Saccostrea cuccullata TaxID=36930 RepID=UPI002ED579BE